MCVLLSMQTQPIRTSSAPSQWDHSGGGGYGQGTNAPLFPASQASVTYTQLQTVPTTQQQKTTTDAPPPPPPLRTPEAAQRTPDVTLPSGVTDIIVGFDQALHTPQPPSVTHHEAMVHSPPTTTTEDLAASLALAETLAAEEAHL
jgi:hypothetical protein